MEGDTITWSVQGDDSGKFEISDAGVLSFKESPDFEAKADNDGDNVYKVTVVAAGKSQGKQDVEVTVTDVDEAGEVTLTKPQPQVSRDLAASFEDPDSGVKDEAWQWSRGPNADGPWTDIDKATNKSRKPVADDVDHYLRATVTYTDTHGAQTASAVSENPVEARTVANAAPDFSDHDTNTGTTGTQATRTVDENAKNANVGKAIERHRRRRRHPPLHHHRHGRPVDRRPTTKTPAPLTLRTATRSQLQDQPQDGPDHDGEGVGLAYRIRQRGHQR